MLFLSWMMVSNVRYPSFKTLDLRATRTFTRTLVAILFVGSIVIFREKLLVFVLPVFFTAYLIYGFVRPRISRRLRREIEEEEGDEDEGDVPGAAA
jgi:CDP-diacylglycerol--serine O-phosphatidyltransferase